MALEVFSGKAKRGVLSKVSLRRRQDQSGAVGKI